MHRTTLCDTRSPAELAPSPSLACTSNAPPSAPFFIESQLQGRTAAFLPVPLGPTDTDRSLSLRAKQGAVSLPGFPPVVLVALPVSRCSLPLRQSVPVRAQPMQMQRVQAHAG